MFLFLFFLVSFRSFCFPSSNGSILSSHWASVAGQSLEHCQWHPTFYQDEMTKFLHFLVLDTKVRRELAVLLWFGNRSHNYTSSHSHSTLPLTKYVHEHSLIDPSQTFYEVDIVISTLWIRTQNHGLRSRIFNNNLRVLSTLWQLPLSLQKSLFTCSTLWLMVSKDTILNWIFFWWNYGCPRLPNPLHP